jgi:hypothetical protein
MAIFLRRRRVRIHLRGETRSLEGIWIGNAAGHYRLAKVEQLEAAGRTLELEGEAWIPRERVLYLQVIG